MMNDSTTRSGALAQRATWGAVLTVATVLTTLALACAMPFAALAVMAAVFLPRREAVALVMVNWIANQAIGYGLMHYPLDWDSLGGGLDLGIAALSSVLVASFAYAPLRKFGAALAVIGTFVAAFAAYEGALYVTALGRYAGDFSASITLYILYTNGVALAGLLALQTLARAVGVVLPRVETGSRVARA